MRDSQNPCHWETQGCILRVRTKSQIIARMNPGIMVGSSAAGTFFNSSHTRFLKEWNKVKWLRFPVRAEPWWRTVARATWMQSGAATCQLW